MTLRIFPNQHLRFGLIFKFSFLQINPGTSNVRCARVREV